MVTLTRGLQTLIDTTRKHTIAEITDIELSKDEDSVASLAVAQSTESSGIAFAGINSSTTDQNAGKNEHLRSFELRYPPRKKTAPGATDTLKEQALESKDATKALGRTSLFTPSNAATKETYQRVLRLSRPMKGDKTRLGAIATGLAPEGEIVAFNASVQSPARQNLVCRIRLGKGEEAADVDILVAPGSGYYLAYCTNHEVCMVHISSMEAQSSKPALIYGSPNPDRFGSTKARPKLRSLRFLTQTLLLLLQNEPDRSGAELILLEISSSPASGKILLRKRLNKSIPAASALSVSLLPASDPLQNLQSTVAIAGQDNSITILTLDHPCRGPFPSLKFRNHVFLQNVHDNQITSLTLSSFGLPSDFATAPPQYLKLASTSINSTVVVHTLPLTPYPLPSATKRSNRYVLHRPGRSEATQIAISVLISALVIALGALALQAFTEIRGGTPEYLGAKGWLSDRVHGWIARPYMFEDTLDKLSVPGVEPRPMKGIQSQVGDVKNSVKSAMKEPEVVAIPAVETKGSEEIKGQAAEAEDSLKEQTRKSKVSGERATEGAKTAAGHAQQSVVEAAAQARNSIVSAQEKLGLRDLLSRRSSPNAKSVSSQNSASDIMVRHDEASKALSADVRDADNVIEETHKKWEELEQHERETWKRRLVDAGEWAVEEGEAVLKGVFFQNIALAVGAAVRAEL